MQAFFSFNALYGEDGSYPYLPCPAWACEAWFRAEQVRVWGYGSLKSGHHKSTELFSYSYMYLDAFIFPSWCFNPFDPSVMKICFFLLGNFQAPTNTNEK